MCWGGRGGLTSKNRSFFSELSHVKVFFGAIFSTYMVYTKTIIHLGVGESGGY